MIHRGKRFRVPGIATQVDSMPVGGGAHCVEGAAANAEDIEARFRKVRRGKARFRTPATASTEVLRVVLSAAEERAGLRMTGGCQRSRGAVDSQDFYEVGYFG